MNVELRKIEDNKWQVVDIDEAFAFDEYFFVIKDEHTIALSTHPLSPEGVYLSTDDILSIGEAMRKLRLEEFEE